MKIRRTILWLAAVVTLLLSLLIWSDKQKSATTPQKGKETVSDARSLPPEQDSDETKRPPAVSSPQLNPAPQVSSSSTDSSLPPAPPGSKAEKMREALSAYNDEPITFYGELEDQSNKPVADAAIDFNIRINNGSQAGTERGQVVSDANGLFTISEHRGADLSIVPKKDGYAIASTNRFVNYSRLFSEEERAHPDPNSPVVIKMWKLQGAEPLLPINKEYKLPYTQAPIHFDLLTGSVTPANGDITLTVSRVPNQAFPGNSEAWNVQVTAVDGGLMNSTDRERITYWAPTEGYQASSVVFFPTNTAGFTRGFFVISRNGQVYTKLRLSLRINEEFDGFMYLALGGVANTNASRNWEGDSNNYKPE